MSEWKNVSGHFCIESDNTTFTDGKELPQQIKQELKLLESENNEQEARQLLEELQKLIKNN